jgi:peptidoglycan hydrolase-like protein with peptidoglycan-binding domain
MREKILATVSAMALGIAGAGPIFAQSNATTPTPAAPSTTAPATGTTMPAMPQAGTAAQPTTPSASGSTDANQPYAAGATPSMPAAANFTQSDIRQAQEKLRQNNLYRGKIDGLVGPEMRQALQQYQQKNGLPVTATLDQTTMNSLLGTDVGQGSSTPPGLPSGTASPNDAGSSTNPNRGNSQ